MLTRSSQTQTLTTQLAVASLLVTLGVALRLYFQYIPNFAPIAALALFAGFYFRSAALAVAVPLSTMLISDQFVGTYDRWLMISVYALLGLPIALRPFLRRHLTPRPGAGNRSAWMRKAATLVGCSLSASIVFFIGTNLAVWQFTAYYEPTLNGLFQCFASAIPFFRYTLIGDLCFAAALFGGYALVVSFAAARQSEPCTATNATL